MVSYKIELTNLHVIDGYYNPIPLAVRAIMQPDKTNYKKELYETFHIASNLNQIKWQNREMSRLA